MMQLKYILLFFLLCGLGSRSNGQSPERHADSLLAKCLERFIEHPYYKTGAAVGVNILRVTKNKELIDLQSVFISDKRFELLNREAVIQHLTKRCGSKFDVLDIIVPVYFYFDDQVTLPQTTQELVDREIRNLIREDCSISSRPVKMFEFLIVR